MKRMHEGLDYRLYQIYIWGGLPLIVIYILIAVLVFDAPGIPGSKGFLITIAPMTLWFAGILLYWWWVFLFKDSKELKELAQQEGIPGISSLKNWNTLHRAMTVHGGSVEEYIANTKKANRPLIIWYGSMNLPAIGIFAFVILGSLGIIPASTFELLLYGVIGWVVLMIVGTPFLFGWGGRSAEKAYLTPLGLKVTKMPGLKPDLISMIGGGQKLIPDGPAIVEGERHGRLVHIETIDKYSLTVLQARMPEFKIMSMAGKLIPTENAPKEITDALKRLRKAKRWQGMQVFSGPEGIAVQRESRRMNMWLYDLWLAEYLTNKMNTSDS